MRRCLIAVIFALVLSIAAAWSQTNAPAAKPMTNVDIVQMVKLGLSDDVIIEKIHTSTATDFDTSIDGLDNLTAAKVSDAVLKTMMYPHPPSTAGQSGRIVDELTLKFQSLKNGVFTVWSEFGHGTGFLISDDGLVLTNQHVVGPSEYIALQFDAKNKIPAVLLASDPERDVAALWADTSAIPGTSPLVIAKADAAGPTLVEGERIFTIGSPLHQQKVITTGTAGKIEKTAIISDVNINHGNSGGPLFNSRGEVVGITTFGDVPSQGGPGISGILKIDEAQLVIEKARAKMATTSKPSSALLPVDPQDAFPIESIKATIAQQKFDTKPYTFNEGDFEIAIITPPLLYYKEWRGEMQATEEKKRRNSKNSVAATGDIKPLDDLRNWGQYLGEYEPVLIVRVSPKLRETNGSKFLRAFAASGGIYAVPAKLRFKSDFYKMKLLCGEKEVIPILPGKIAHILDVRSWFVNATDATYEGFYTYPADAVTPSCGNVRLEIFSEKKPDTPLARDLSEKTISRISGDFEPYLALHR
jgi:S1-C subfamily serine protease